MIQVADQEDGHENDNPQAGEARKVGHHQDVDGASDSEAEHKRQEEARDGKLRHEAKRQCERIGKGDEPDRFRHVRQVKGDEPREPETREPTSDAREALRIERRWQRRYRFTRRIDLRAGEVLDVGDRLNEAQQTTKTRLQLRDLSPRGLRRSRSINCTYGRREIVRGELAMRDCELADCILERLTSTGRPDQEPDQAVARDTERCFPGTGYGSLEIVHRVGGDAGKCNDRHREPGNVPEIRPGSARHHVGAKADKDAHAYQELPAILRKQDDESDGCQTPKKGPGKPQQTVVQRFSDTLSVIFEQDQRRIQRSGGRDENRCGDCQPAP